MARPPRLHRRYRLRAGHRRGRRRADGHRGPWLAFTTEHDDVDAHSTLVFAHAPENLDEKAAIHPSTGSCAPSRSRRWRSPWAFFEEFELPPGESFAYRYRIVVADGAWDGDRVRDVPEGAAW